MKILLATIGTRGDVQPFLALALGLKAAGHDVAICTCPRFRGWVTDYGFEFFDLEEGLLELLESDLGRSIIQDLNGVVGVLRTIPKVIRKLKPIHQRMLADCWAATEACQPDIIVYHPKLFFVPSFAAVRNIPAILAMFSPLHVPTGESPLFGPSFGSLYNRNTYRMVHRISTWGTRSYLRDWRAQHDPQGLSRHSSPTQISPGQPIPVMHAFSAAVFPRPRDWPTTAILTGYWFLPEPNSDRQRWTPPTELTSFLGTGPPPVYFGFGSMAGTDPAGVTRLIVAAAKKSKVRAVLSTGWGGVAAVESSAQIHVLESAPHRWLFPRMAAVVHHGGAGTTAAGLRAGCPTIICPFGLDQPFWGRRVQQLGAGLAPIPQSKLTVAKLAAAVAHVTKDESFRSAAQNVSQAIQQEDGVHQAVAAIKRLTQSASRAISC